MTGEDVARARRSLGLSVPQFADLVGASVSSVYRWEGTPGEVKVDPFPRRLLGVLEERKDALSDVAFEELALRVRHGIQVRGGLYGLYILLASVYIPAGSMSVTQRPRIRKTR